MAPAIAHFLVGAALVLLVVTPIAYRYDFDLTITPLLIPLGGIWGIAPDVHHIAPVYADQLYAIHNSPWVDLFALHYLLDTPTVRAQYHLSVFGSIVLFTVAIGLYTIAVRTTSTRLHPALATVVATGYAGLPVSVLAFHGDRYEQFAALAGADGFLTGWLVLAATALVAGIAIAALHETVTVERLLPRLEYHAPAVPALASVPLGLLLWLTASIAVPAWLRTTQDTTAALPWIDWAVLVWVLLFTVVFSAVYGLVRLSESQP